MTQHARRRLVQLGAAGPLLQFALAASLGLGLLLALAPVTLSGVSAAGVGLGTIFYAAGCAAAGIGLHLRYPHAALGLCNTVTLFRLMLVGMLGMALVPGATAEWAVFVIAALALALDGVDGWLARREKLVSSFGARFDMEVDSVLALVLALLAFVGGHAGPLVILLGLPRYAFAVAGLVLPWLNAPLPERFSRKVVCVLQLATLISLQAPILPSMLANVLVGASAMALVWSFERDVVWLWKARV